MATVNIRESLRKLDEDTSYKYDLLTMYDSCPLLDNDKKIIARMLYDKEDPEVIYDRLQLYLDDDIASDLDNILDIDTLSKSKYESFINHCVEKLAEIYDYVQYNEDIDAIQITQGDKIRNIKVNLFVDNKLDNYQVSIDEGSYDIQTFEAENDAIDYVVSIVNQRMNSTDEDDIDDEIDCCSIYDVVENNGQLTAKGIIESTNELKDIDLGKINTAQANELLNNILNNPNYKVSADTISKINNNSAPWGLAVQMVGSVDVDATNGLLTVGDIGGDMSVVESVDKSFDKGSKVTDGRRNGTVLDYDSEMVLVDWDYSDTDDIEWIDKKNLDLYDSANESINDIETKTNARKLVDKAKSEGKKLSMKDAEEVVDQSFNKKCDNIDDFYKTLDLSESAVSGRYVWFDYDDIKDVKPAPQQIIDAYNVKYPDYSDPLVDIQQIDLAHRSYPEKELHYIVTDNQGNKFWAIVGNTPESKLEQILEAHEDDFDPKQPSFKDLIKRYKNYTTFKDIEENSGLIRDLCDDLENKNIPHHIYTHVKDNGITIFYDDFDIVEDFDVDDIVTSEQEFDSAATSINSNKLPAIYKLIDLKPGSVVVDFGGGKFDNAVEYLKDKDVTLLVYDPYNRSADHNKEVLEILKKNGGADAAVNSNVLNVIKEPEARNAVLQNIKKITKKGAPIYITVYEGPTKSGYQLNRKTSDYIDEISQVFSNVNRKGKLIIAINESLSKSLNESELETLKQNYLKAKEDFETLGEKDNNDVLSREEKMLIAKAEYEKALGNPIDESSLVDKKVSTLGKRGKPMYFTADQLKDAKAKYPEYDFEETTIDKSLPQGQKAYIAKKRTNESKSIKEAKKLHGTEESQNTDLHDGCSIADSKEIKTDKGVFTRFENHWEYKPDTGKVGLSLSDKELEGALKNHKILHVEPDKSLKEDSLSMVDLNKPVKISSENFNKMCRDHYYLQSLSSAEFHDLRNQVVQGEFTKIQLINEIRSDPTLRGETIDTIERVLNQYINKNSTELIKECNATIDEGVDKIMNKLAVKKELEDKVYNAFIKLALSPTWGYDDKKEVEFYIMPKVEVSDYTENDFDFKVEFRAGLSYSELVEACETLDKIVMKYDENAYFEPVQPVIANAFITLPKDLNESVREYTNKLLDMVDEGIVDKDILIRELLNYMSEDEVKDFVITNEYDD